MNAVDRRAIVFEPAAGGAFQRRGEPVTFGVSLPMGWCRSLRDLSLVGVDGRSVPIQSRRLDRWSDDSVRWLLIDAFVSTDAAGRGIYHLTRAADTPREPVPAQLKVTGEGHAVVVDTGTARFALRSGGPCVFKHITTAYGPALDASRSGLSVTGFDETPYAVSFDDISVCEIGAIRSEVVAVGWAERTRRGRQLRLTLRLQFFAGSSAVRAFLTITNPQAARHPNGFWELGSAGAELLRDVRLTLALPQASWLGQPTCSLEPSAPFEVLEQPLHLFQESSGGAMWSSPAHRNRSGVVPVSFQGYRFDSAGSFRSGSRATPVVSLRRNNLAISLVMPRFWENFPKTLDVSNDAVAIGLFPRDHRDVHELQGGEQKTHTFVVAFGDDPVSAQPLAWCRSPLVASAAAVHHAGCPSEPTIGAASARERCDCLVNGAIDGDESFLMKRERVDEYGWRNFGDLYADHEAVRRTGGQPLVSHYNNQYDAIAGFAWQFAHSGDRRWWELTDDLASHVVDIDLYHTSRDKAAYNHGYFWHTNHYIDAGRATHRAYPRSGGTCGGGPSAEHNYTTGLLWHYYLTGSARSRDAVIELADWVLAMDDGRRTKFRWLDSGPTGLASATYSSDFHGPGRGAGNSINALVDAHRLTAEAKYLRKAEELVRRCIHPADDQDARGLRDPESRWSYTAFLQGLGKYLEHRYEQGLVDGEYRYARACLLRYAKWMAANETPYLDRPERLQFPTETWAVQDMRKAAVFEFAARHVPSGTERQAFLERATFFFNASMDTLYRRATRALTRPVVLLLAYMCQRPALDLTGVPPADAAALESGAPASFTPYKRRLAKRVLLAGAASAVGAVMVIIRVLLR